MYFQRLTMSATLTTTSTSVRKRAVNLTLNEGLVARAKTYTSNLSATMEELLTAYVAQQQQARLTRQQQADAAAMDWNAVHASVGSFADEHSTL
jgi:antitoxin CcdA